jgi:hypothetical protein
VIPQYPADHRPLHSASATVDDPDLREPPRRRRPEVLVHHGSHVPGREGVEVQGVADGDDDRQVAQPRPEAVGDLVADPAEGG